MLRWRILLGILLVTALVGIAWLDHQAEVREWPIPLGMCLLPVAVLFAVAATGEMVQLADDAASRDATTPRGPAAWPIYCGNLLLVASGWLPSVPGADGGAACYQRTAWSLAALALGVMLVLAVEMRRYERPGRVTANLTASVFNLVYVGLMLSFVVQLRMGWGVAALASLLIVVKMGDTGAYTVGRLIGRHRMAPVLSPGKTIEGAIGGLAFSCLGARFALGWMAPRMVAGSVSAEPWQWLLFGLLVGGTGMMGDLAESLLKRDAGRKDSSRWLPGFGGIMDLLDSILLAAPVAWVLWATGLAIGRT